VSSTNKGTILGNRYYFLLYLTFEAYATNANRFSMINANISEIVNATESNVQMNSIPPRFFVHSLRGRMTANTKDANSIVNFRANGLTPLGISIGAGVVTQVSNVPTIPSEVSLNSLLNWSVDTSASSAGNLTGQVYVVCYVGSENW